MFPFSMTLISEIIKSRNNLVSTKNIDTWRFPQQELTPERPDRQKIFNYLNLIVRNHGLFDKATSFYTDDTSRDLLRLLYCFRALGPSCILLPTNTKKYWENFEIGATWWHKSSEKEIPPFEIALYHAKFMGKYIELECWLGNVVFSFISQQYFFDRDGLRIAPSTGDYVIDGGGCFGDTALEFSVAVGDTGRVFSFEPVPRLKEIFTSNVTRNAALARNIELFGDALSNVSGQILPFNDSGAGSRRDENGALQVASITIDDFVRERNLPRLDYIKMDIEGSEREALKGAAETIRRFRPKLAISGYHRWDDLLIIPALIKKIEPSYKFVLDNYTIHAEESVIFASV